MPGMHDHTLPPNKHPLHPCEHPTQRDQHLTPTCAYANQTSVHKIAQIMRSCP